MSAVPTDRPARHSSAAAMETRCAGARETPDLQLAPRGCARTQFLDWAGSQDPGAGVPSRLRLAPSLCQVLDSSVARGATRELLNAILRNQSGAERDLIRRRRVVHAEHRVARPHVAFRLAVAVETPFHLQRL